MKVLASEKKSRENVFSAVEHATIAFSMPTQGTTADSILTAETAFILGFFRSKCICTNWSILDERAEKKLNISSIVFFFSYKFN